MNMDPVRFQIIVFAVLVPLMILTAFVIAWLDKRVKKDALPEVMLKTTGYLPGVVLILWVLFLAPTLGSQTPAGDIRTLEDLARFQTGFASEVEKILVGLFAFLVAVFVWGQAALRVLLSRTLKESTEKHAVRV